MKDSFDLPLNERDTTQKDSPLMNLTSFVKSIVTPIQDLLKTTKKDGSPAYYQPYKENKKDLPSKEKWKDSK